MEDYMVIIWCVAFVLAAVIIPGKVFYATVIMSIIVTILASVSNVPDLVDPK